MRAEPTNDLVDVELIGLLVKNLLAVDAHDEDPMIASHKRHPFDLLAELPEDCFLDIQRAVQHPAGDAVLDFDSSHGVTNGSAAEKDGYCRSPASHSVGRQYSRAAVSMKTPVDRP